MQGWFNNWTLLTVIHHISKIKDKKKIHDHHHDIEKKNGLNSATVHDNNYKLTKNMILSQH